MSISQLLKESITVSKNNPLIFVPMLVAGVFSALVSLALVGSTVPVISRFAEPQSMVEAEEALAAAGAAMGGVFLVIILSAIVGLLAHGMTVAMSDLALKGDKAGLGGGWKRLMARLVPIIIASILVGVIVGIGMMLLVLPGIIAAFLLMFTLVAVMVDDAGAFDALRRSFRTVTKNFKASFIFFLVVLALGLLVGLLGVILGLIPVLGPILSMIVGALYTGFVSVFVLRVYRELQAQPEGSPEPEV